MSPQDFSTWTCQALWRLWVQTPAHRRTEHTRYKGHRPRKCPKTPAMFLEHTRSVHKSIHKTTKPISKSSRKLIYHKNEQKRNYDKTPYKITIEDSEQQSIPKENESMAKRVLQRKKNKGSKLRFLSNK